MSYSPYFLNQQSQGSVKGTVSNFQNASGSTLAKGTAVAVNTSSQLVLVDPSNEAIVQAIVGLTSIAIPNAATGGVQDNGRLENVTTSFAIGDALYIAKDGSLTNVKPEIGVSSFTDGDFVIFVGVVVKNEFNVSLKDIKLMISIIGQL